MAQNNTSEAVVNCKEKIEPIPDVAIHILMFIVIVFCSKYYR